MRKILIVAALALMNIGAPSVAMAKDNCKQVMGACLNRCFGKYERNDNALVKCSSDCDLAARMCSFSNAGTFNSNEVCTNNRCGQSDGGGPDLQHERSHPKQVNGQAQRTADGGTIMVTPEGKEWVWNGKYNTVATYERNGVIGEYHSVMQGDPDAPSRMVNGKMMKVSDPRYQAEADAAVAKQKAEEAAKQAAQQKAASKQTKGLIEAAKDPNGILKRDGTKIIKEDIDDPRSRSGQNGANSSASKAAANAHSSVANPVSATAGSANAKFKPPASAPVTTAPVNAPVTTPPAAVSGIDRRPGRNAQ